MLRARYCQELGSGIIKTNMRAEMTHDFRHAAMHRLADWPVLARIGARRTDASRLDSREVAYLYTLATEAEWQDMNVTERDFAGAALSRDNPPYYDVYAQPIKPVP